jgi:hypothetical protein
MRARWKGASGARRHFSPASQSSLAAALRLRASSAASAGNKTASSRSSPGLIDNDEATAGGRSVWRGSATDARQHRVLDDIGEIAGMKGVAIIHRRQTDEPAAFVKFCRRPGG